MNRKTLSISIIMFSFLFASGNAKAESISEPVEKSIESVDPIAVRIRLKELKSVNKSTLTAQERRELRQEVRQVRSQLDEPGAGGGIWISIIPVLVVIALIIILM